jgi:hypothetical protein
MISLKNESLPYLKIFLEAVTNEIWEDDNMELDPSDLLGMYVQATVITKMGTDNVERNQIQRWFPNV